MRIQSTLFRGARAALGLALLAGAFQAAAQNPVLVVHQQLQFAHQAGSTLAPPPQTVRVYSGAPVTFTASAATSTGGGWLFVNNALTVTGNTGSAPDLTISVSPSLPVGNYTGTVTVVSGGTTSTIVIQYSVTTNPVVRLDPSSIVHRSVEARQTVSVPVSLASSGVGTTVTSEVVVTEPQTGWVAVLNPGATGNQAQIVISAANIPADRTLAMAIVRFTTPGGSQVTMPISVSITPGAQIQLSPSTVTFPWQISFQTPGPRSVNVTSTTQSQLTYTASIVTSAPWLTLSNTNQTTPGNVSIIGNTPGQFWLIPNIAAIPAQPGILEAKVRVESTTGSSQELTVRLNVSNQPQLTLSQDAAAFSYTLGGIVPSSQSITIGTTSFVQAITATPTYTTGGTWFTVSPTVGNTPTTLTITIDPARLAQLTAGTYTGSIRVVSSTSDVTIPVSLTVSGSALITVEPLTLDPFTWQAGQPTPPERTLVIRSTDATNQPFTIAPEYGAGATGWLLLSATSGSTGSTGFVLRLNVNTSAVASPGTYEAAIVITPTGVAAAPAVRVPIRYLLTGTAQVTATPSSITVTQVGTTPPASQTLQLTSGTPGLTFLAQSSAPWIILSSTSGAIPGSISVSFNSSTLSPGDYSGTVTISVGGAQTINVPVALRVQSAAALQVSTTSLSFSALQTGTPPAAQTISLTSTGVPLNYTATVATGSGGGWLRVSPGSGTTPQTISVSVDTTGLAAGSYTGTITLAAQNASNPSTTINVSLTVTAQAVPQIRAMVNAANGLARGVSPGMIATLFGTNMAPSTATTGIVTNGVVQTTLSEVQVLFDNVPAPILYAGPGGGQDQINVVVPYGVGGRASTSIIVSYRGVRSAPITFNVADASPGIFTIPSGGSGQGAILNQNNTVNAAANPARPGEVIQIYATGEGAVFPAVGDGRIIQPVVSDLRKPVGAVTVRLGDVTLTPDYAGSAPGLVTGAFQVNVTIPASFAASGNVPVVVTVGGVQSQPGVTVAIGR